MIQQPPPPPRTPAAPQIGLSSADALRPINTVYAVNVTADQQLMTGIGQVTQATLVNLSTTVGAKIVLYDGTDTTGDVIGGMGAIAGSGDDFGPGYPGIPFRRGIFLHIIAGAVTVSVTYVPQIDHW